MARKYFWESVQEKLNGDDKKIKLTVNQLKESIAESWCGDKDKIQEACNAINEIARLYDTDKDAKTFMEALDKATTQLCEGISESKDVEDDKGEELDEESPLQRMNNGSTRKSQIPSSRLREQDEAKDEDDAERELDEGNDESVYLDRLSKMSKIVKQKSVKEDEELDEESPLQRMNNGSTRKSQIPSSRLREEEDINENTKQKSDLYKQYGRLSNKQIDMIYDYVSANGIVYDYDMLPKSFRDKLESIKFFETIHSDTIRLILDLKYVLRDKKLYEVSKKQSKQAPIQMEESEKYEKRLKMIEESIIKRASEMVL